MQNFELAYQDQEIDCWLRDFKDYIESNATQGGLGKGEGAFPVQDQETFYEYLNLYAVDEEWY